MNSLILALFNDMVSNAKITQHKIRWRYDQSEGGGKNLEQGVATYKRSTYGRTERIMEEVKKTCHDGNVNEQ
jgi:hypothetical protein